MRILILRIVYLGPPLELDRGFSLKEIWSQVPRGRASDGDDYDATSSSGSGGRFLDLTWTLPRGMSLREKFLFQFRDEQEHLIRVGIRVVRK